MILVTFLLHAILTMSVSLGLVLLSVRRPGAARLHALFAGLAVPGLLAGTGLPVLIRAFLPSVQDAAGLPWIISAAQGLLLVPLPALLILSGLSRLPSGLLTTLRYFSLSTFTALRTVWGPLPGPFFVSAVVSDVLLSGVMAVLVVFF